MLLCDNADHQPEHPNRWNVTGLLHALTFAEGTVFPTHHPLLTVLLHLTGGRGGGQANITCVHADSEQDVFATAPRSVQFGEDPLSVVGLVFRILDVPIPERGLYYVQFCYNGEAISQQPLLVR
jgi:hypothetical protein